MKSPEPPQSSTPSTCCPQRLQRIFSDRDWKNVCSTRRDDAVAKGAKAEILAEGVRRKCKARGEEVDFEQHIE
eukprot:758968-Hanusia_phi.AAC.3